MKVVCFKWEHRGGYKLPNGIGRYTAAHVNRLQRAVAKHLSIPHEFICITDDPVGVECRTIPLWNKCMDKGACFNRLYVFSEDMRNLIGERFICIDLDVVITGSMDDIVSRPEDFVINQYYDYGNTNRDQYYNGALIMMDAGARSHVWERFAEDIDGNVEMIKEKREQRKLVGSDQAWISHTLGRGEAMFTDEDDGVMAYRLLQNDGHGKRLTKNSRMVFFAGVNDPTKSYYTNSWIREYWDGEVRYNDIKSRLEVIDMLRSETEKGYKECGYAMDILNPRSLSEKLIYRKLFHRDEMLVNTADKYAVKEMIPGELVIPTLQLTDDVSKIKFNRDMVLKPTHTSGYNVVYHKGDNVIPIRSKLKRALMITYGKRKGEWYYQHIKPQIMCEPLLELKTPSDYKFHMFHGRCELIHVSNVEGGERYFAYYSPDWRRLDVKDHKMNDITRPKPRNLARMIQIAEKLSAPFDFVRIDLLAADKLYFGEFTHFPSCGHLRFVPMAFDFEMGGKL